MPMPFYSVVILTITAFFSSIITGTTGMGGGVLLLGVLASFIEITYVVPFHAFIMLISCGTRVILFIRHIHWGIFAWYVLGMLPGALAGIYIFKLLPKDLIKLAMGIFILASFFIPVTRKEGLFSHRVFFFVGLIAGFFGIFFGSTGPLTAPFFIRRGIIKEEFISTKAACQTVTNVVKIQLFGFVGVNVFAYENIILYLGIAVILGLLIGKGLLNHISERGFLLAFKGILVIIAGRLIIVQLLSLLGYA